MRIARKVRALAPYVHGEQPRGSRIIKINTNEAAYPPSRKVMAELGRIDSDSLRLYSDASCTELCKALAKLNGTQPENVFVGLLKLSQPRVTLKPPGPETGPLNAA